MVAVANLRKFYSDEDGFHRATRETSQEDFSFSQYLFVERFREQPLHVFDPVRWPVEVSPSGDVRELWRRLCDCFPRDWKETSRAGLVLQLQTTERPGLFTGASITVASTICPSFPSYRAMQLVSSNYVVSIALTTSSSMLLIVGRVHASMKPTIIYPCLLRIDASRRRLVLAECACPTGYVLCPKTLSERLTLLFHCLSADRMAHTLCRLITPCSHVESVLLSLELALDGRLSTVRRRTIDRCMRSPVGMVERAFPP